ncbi:MAG: hypothetical protein US60_C0008G0031 [Microgenomates group bacterium GW2011_GWC1_37_8]|uniref:Uncharacterized protein n=1 Tax=Candidatus Woesebacteria bacterium GW2011_GWB1_38_8 TaxID=1618570 RepID=A0A0G0L4C2_9BACT|nr:MAG: hypothetical protein US60_C0008G0031 [Microgenomates group bacterium GW2011_GWC1_37_8]KKQ85867.1 MAG: hypothetical protein UT08_C0003G0030 [Candidatus Woesebacteria bacterium GW2011_GWB1_38_8]
MNYFYQITISNISVFPPNQVHNVIIKLPNVLDWWHYLPNSYIVETASTSKFFADKIIESLPGLNFIITKLDINEYNGYLDKRAWEWLNKKTGATGVRYVPHNPSSLMELLSGYKPTPPNQTDIALDAIDRILGKKK